MITIAPEVVDQKIIDLIQENNIVISAGHTNASYELANSFLNKGITVGTHLYNAMSSLQHRAPGVVVNLSDIYAMNATPTQITMSIAFSNRFSLEALEEFYEGVNIACEKYDVDLIGGDTSTSQKGFIISVTALGEVAPDKYIKRSTAESGDLICVSKFSVRWSIKPNSPSLSISVLSVDIK